MYFYLAVLEFYSHPMYLFHITYFSFRIKTVKLKNGAAKITFASYFF